MQWYLTDNGMKYIYLSPDMQLHMVATHIKCNDMEWFMKHYEKTDARGTGEGRIYLESSKWISRDYINSCEANWISGARSGS